MKRYIGMALIVALLAAFTLAPATAEAPEVVCEPVDGLVPTTSDPGEMELIFEDTEPIQAEAPEAPASEGPTQEEIPAQEAAASAPYARVQSDGAVLCADPDGAQTLGTVGAGSVVLALGGEARTRVALYVPGGVIVGYMDAAALAPLTDAERAAYLDAAAVGEVALYENDLNLPLTLAAFTEAAPAEQAPEEAPAEAQPEETLVEQPESTPIEETPAEQPAPLPVEETPAAEGSLPEGAGSPTGETEG